MTARSEILSRLKGTPTVLPKLKTRVRKYDHLGEQFATALKRSKGETYLVASKEAAMEKLGELLVELDVETVITHREYPIEETDIPAVFPDIHWFIAGETDDLRTRCAQVDLGLTSADYAFAETGSLVLVSGENKARMASLLPPLHIVLLPESRILPSIFDWVALRPDPFPANLVLVSGPSKTADIEQILIVGVHGPKRLIVIIYMDSNS